MAKRSIGRILATGLLVSGLSGLAAAQGYPQTGAQGQNGAQGAGQGTEKTAPVYGAKAPVRPLVLPATPLPAPMTEDNPTQKQLNSGITQRLDPPGYGWCRFTDDANKHTFYTAPFKGSPKHDVTPRDIAFADYIHRTYPSAVGNVDCNWLPYDSAYDSKSNEDRAESADQLRNYTMTNTQWAPTSH